MNQVRKKEAFSFLNHHHDDIKFSREAKMIVNSIAYNVLSPKPFYNKGLQNKTLKTENVRFNNFSDSLEINFKGREGSEELERMREELPVVADDILEDVKEIVKIYRKATRTFFKKAPEAEGRSQILIRGNKMIEYTENGRRVTVFRDGKPVKIVEYNETGKSKNIMEFNDGVIVLYQEGIRENPSHYDEIKAEIIFRRGMPVFYRKDIIRTPDGGKIPLHSIKL